MTSSPVIKGVGLLVALVAVGAVLYFGFFRTNAPQTTANTNATPTSKLPAKEHILGLTDASQDLKTFMSAEYDRQNAECKQAAPSAELAMGVYGITRDSFAAASLGCGENGQSGYYAKVDGTWKLAFKAEDIPTCSDVDSVHFTKEIVPECLQGDQIKENQNP